jgi:hypothetical protein
MALKVRKRFPINGTESLCFWLSLVDASEEKAKSIRQSEKKNVRIRIGLVSWFF